MLDQLTGKAVPPTYRAPINPSQKVETEVRGNKAYFTVPGQPGAVRVESLQKLAKEDVVGVVHLVCNGFGRINEISPDNYTLDDLRAKHHEYELEDLREVCTYIQQNINTYRKTKWLLIALAKVDLYHSSRSEALQYYSPTGNSVFSKTLQNMLLAKWGALLKITTVPVCSLPLDYQYGSRVLRTQFDIRARDAQMEQFINTLNNLCGS